MFEGQFENGMRNGKGICKWKLKPKSHQGVWKNNKEHGLFKYIDELGIEHFEEWVDGVET